MLQNLGHVYFNVSYGVFTSALIFRFKLGGYLTTASLSWLSLVKRCVLHYELKYEHCCLFIVLIAISKSFCFAKRYFMQIFISKYVFIIVIWFTSTDEAWYLYFPEHTFHSFLYPHMKHNQATFPPFQLFCPGVTDFCSVLLTEAAQFFLAAPYLMTHA